MTLLTEVSTAVAGIPKDFFTATSLATLAGATGAVYVVCSTVQHVFDYNPKWLALLVSIIVSYLAAYLTVSDGHDTTKYIIAFFNGCLIYITATGSNAMLGTSGTPGAKPAGAVVGLQPKRTFTTRWFN